MEIDLKDLLLTYFFPMALFFLIIVLRLFFVQGAAEIACFYSSHEQKGPKALKFLPFYTTFSLKVWIHFAVSESLSLYGLFKNKQTNNNIGIHTICLFKASEEMIHKATGDLVSQRAAHAKAWGGGVAGSRIPLIGRHYCRQTCAHHGLKPRGARG